MDLAGTIILLCSCAAGAGGEERPGPGLRPSLGAAGLSPFLPISPPRRGAGLGAAGPSPWGAASQRPGGRPRLGRRPRLSFPSPAPRAWSALSCSGPLPLPPRAGLALPPLSRDFPPPRTFFPHSARLRRPMPGSALLLRGFSHSGLGSRFPVPVLRRRAEAAASPRACFSPPLLPGTRKRGQAESSSSGNRRRARDFPGA